MQHQIETNGASNFGRDFETIRAITIRVAEAHSGCEFEVNDDRMNLRVVATCNGAALRDLVEALDKAGFLE